METENKTLAGVLNYFIENIKEAQKNGYNKKEIITCLIDMHINALNILEQIGEDEEEQIFIKILLYDCFKKREKARLESLLAEKGASHG